MESMPSWDAFEPSRMAIMDAASLQSTNTAAQPEMRLFGYNDGK